MVMLVIVIGAGALAQETQNVAMAPIECYWRTSTSAVHIGEVFTIDLTCGVLETASTIVVPDQSRLDPDVVQLQPFEVVGGTAGEELRTSTHRYFQYQYQLRYIAEEIGRDVNLPALTLTYRVQSRVKPDSAAVESRESRYILPARPIRILSLMTGGAVDIREPSPPTFEEIRDRRFTASTLRIVALALFSLGAVSVAWGLMRLLRQRRRHHAVVIRLASDAAILRGVRRELEEVRAHAQTVGWDHALAARALAALRVASNYELGRPVAQRVGKRTSAVPGQIHVSRQWPRDGSVLLSGSATAAQLARERTRAEAEGRRSSRRLSDLHDALSTFASVAYGRNVGPPDSGALDEALRAGAAAVSALRREHGWLATRLRALQHSLTALRNRAWAR